VNQVNRVLPMLALLGGVLAAQPVQAGFLGNTLLIEWYFPDLGTVIATENPVVGGGIEFVGRFGGPDIDVADTTIQFTGAVSGSFSPASFNGFVFTDSLNSIDDILGVSIQSQTGYTDFDAADISFTANSISVNFQGATSIDGADGNQVTLSVRFADGNGGNGGQVPEPATLALLSIGIAGLAFMRRRKRAT
jgi:PEP-CTERM motif